MMYAQLTYFDGPRTPEQLAAADFARRERITPAVSKLGHSYRVYVHGDFVLESVTAGSRRRLPV